MRSIAVLKELLQSDLPNQPEPFPLSDMTIADARASSLLNSFSKKFEDDVGPDADAACLSLFLNCNDKCKSFVLEPSKLFHDQVINEVKCFFDDFFYRGPDLLYTSFDLEDGMGTGPGASLQARSHNFYSKLFDSPLTYTDDRLPVLYRQAIRSSPIWVDAEKQRDLRFGYRKVAGNQLSYVPKTNEISRSICTEPSLNMLFQKGLGAIFERVLKRRFCIDLSTQPARNRSLARTGSIDGLFGTIDLKSASDSISLNLLKEILPPYVFQWVCLFRSPTVTLPDGSCRELYMVSSMGNGFTFPLQTLLFATIVRACYKVLGIKPRFHRNGPNNFGVFGDDIIVLKDSYVFVTEVLETFGFVVNKSKSFNTGSFRESCGGDFFHGHDVRGVYVKSLKHETDVFSTLNRLVRWSARSGILLPKVSHALYGWCRFLPIPYHAGDTEGIKVPFSALRTVRRDQTGCIYYRALVPVPNSFKVPLGDDDVRFYPQSKGRKIGFNYEGIIVSCVGGFIRDKRITLRDDIRGKRRYKVRVRKTPHWRHFDSAALERQVHDWEVVYDLLEFSSGR